MTFDEAFKTLLGHEGGYSNHPADKGGATMWGVTEAVARKNGYSGDMKDLTQEFAKTIYKNLYWDAVKAEELPDEIRFAVFDAAVNSGPATAAKWLQEAVGEKQDGLIGAVTLGAVAAIPPLALLMKINSIRLMFMTDQPNWNSFSKGWARRIAANMIGRS